MWLVKLHRFPFSFAWAMVFRELALLYHDGFGSSAVCIARHGKGKARESDRETDAERCVDPLRP